MKTPSPAVRAYIYRVCLVSFPILVLFGIIAGDQVQVWANFASAVLGVTGATVALPNVPPND
jgi:hypothetical protein